MLKGVLFAFITLAGFAVASSAEGAVTVLGGALAKDCSDAAISGRR